MSHTAAKTDTRPRPAAARAIKPLPAAHLPSDFVVARVERTDMPDGGKGQTWYRYVLDNGRSKITGQRRGSLKDVTAHAQRYAEQLNARSLGAPSIWAPRKPDVKAKT